jgi:hypothetical protein
MLYEPQPFISGILSMNGKEYYEFIEKYHTFHKYIPGF